MRSAIEVLSCIAVIFLSVFVYDTYFVERESPKPSVSMDSTYFWISASQLDTLNELRSRVDSFTVRAKAVPLKEKRIWLHDTVLIKNDPSTGVLDLSLYNVWEIDTVFSRGKDSLNARIGFTEYPYARFMFINAWNDEQVLVKEKIITNTVTKPIPLITHGPTVSIGLGIINKKPDIYVGWGFTFNF